MERVWDYFMRRKGILGLVLVISAVAGFIGYRALDQNHTIPDHTYIAIANWGEDSRLAGDSLADSSEIQIPLTGGESSTPTYIVISPKDLVQLPAPETPPSVEDNMPASPDSLEDIFIALGEPVIDRANPVTADTLTEMAPDVEVPLVGEMKDESGVVMSGGPLNILLSGISFMLIILFGYLIYQHFYR